MRTRSALFVGLSATLFTLADSAYAQRPNLGQQAQQPFLNNLTTRALGQPTTDPNQVYGAYLNQVTGPYQVRRPMYGPNGPQTYFGNGYGQAGYPQNRQGFSGQQAAQRYQLPAQYNGHAPGSSLSYGDANYVVNRDGTMSPTVRPALVAQRYQIPTGFAGAAPGSTITHGSAHYAINADGTMSPLSR